MKNYVLILKDHLRRTFSVDILLSRIEKMGAVSVIAENPVDINQEKSLLIEKVDSLIEELQTLSSDQEQNPAGTDYIQGLVEYKNDLLTNDSYAGCTISTIKEAFESIIADVAGKRKRNIERALNKAVLFIQLFGVTRGNPLNMMQGYKLVNGAWRNGSIEGYPVILLLDSLPRTYSITKRTLKSLLNRTQSHQICLAEESYKALSSGNQKLADDIFGLLLNKLFNDRELKNTWNNAYKAISPLFGFKAPNETLPDSKNPVHDKIIVSGMGWSGSGAVFAYLKEFQEIQHVDTEIQHLTGASSIKTLREKSRDKDLFAEEFLRFFGLGLFGYAGYSDYQEYRTLIHASQFTLADKGALAYAMAVQRFCISAVDSCSDGTINLEVYNQAADRLLTDIAASTCDIENRTLLFDNIIKMHELTELDHLLSARIIPVYRDPRSNYAALCRESVKFNPSVHQYVLNYRKRREKTQRQYEAMKNEDKVRFVQFEDFVTDAEYRKDLAGWLGLDLERHDEFSCFKPWISEKNVLNYTDFEDQKAISVIEKELSEYLWKK